MDDHHFECATPHPDDDDCWRKGPWTSREDKLLVDHVNLHGEGKWNSVSKVTGLRRSGKSCRLRWVNYLRPDLKRGNITPQEELIIQELHAMWGNRWSAIARNLPGRTDNEIKNYWRTHFKNSKPSSKSVEKARARFLVRRRPPQQQKEEGAAVPQRQQEDHGNQNEEEEERETMRKRAEEATALVEEEEEMAYMDCVLRGGGNLDGGYASDGGSNGEDVLWGGLWNLD